MITFVFKINNSFLKYPNHPITIPHRYNDSLVRAIYGGDGKRKLPIRIFPPNARTLSGEIYYGVANYGPYYQIKVLGAYPSDYFGNLRIGEMVEVSIERSEGKVNVKITPFSKIRERIEKLGGCPKIENLHF